MAIYGWATRTCGVAHGVRRQGSLHRAARQSGVCTEQAVLAQLHRQVSHRFGGEAVGSRTRLHGKLVMVSIRAGRSVVEVLLCWSAWGLMLPGTGSAEPPGKID